MAPATYDPVAGYPDTTSYSKSAWAGEFVRWLKCLAAATSYVELLRDGVLDSYTRQSIIDPALSSGAAAFLLEKYSPSFPHLCDFTIHCCCITDAYASVIWLQSEQFSANLFLPKKQRAIDEVFCHQYLFAFFGSLHFFTLQL